MDKTANDTVTIDNCVFKNMPRAIGTHNYSYGHPHKNITISNCSISNVSSFGIGIMYWHGALIENNTITGKYAKGKDVFDGIIGYGAIDNTIRNNTICNFRYPLLFKGYQDEHFKKWYKPIYNTFTGEELKEMYSNNCAGLAYDIPPHQNGRDQCEDDAGKQHALRVKPLLMIGFVHMLCALQPEHRKIGKQHPIKETGVIDADPCHQAKGKQKALPEGFRPGNKCAGQQDTCKKQHAEAFGQDHIF